MDLWGKLLARSFPHTPFKNSLTKISKENSIETDRQAAQVFGLALAHANSQGPPRPCELRGFKKQKNGRFINRPFCYCSR